MTDSAGQDADVVIFRPLAERLSRPVARQKYRNLRLIDRGDHVEWQGGPQVRRWRLPDQDGDYPQLAAIVRSYERSAIGVGGVQRIAFVDPSGAVLAYLAIGGRRAIVDEQAREMLPDDAYLPLIGRGVDVVDETFRSDKQWLDRHPEPDLHGFMRSYRRHPVLWIWGVGYGVLAVASVILWSSGYFANR